MDDFRELTKNAEKMIERRQFKSMQRTYNKLLKDYPEHTVFICYNHAMAIQHYIGDADKARSLYQMAIEYLDRVHKPSPEYENWKAVEALISENMMLLSLSYEEYNKWARRLEKVDPHNEILNVHKQTIDEQKRKGIPWYKVLFGMAQMYYSPERDKNVGRYGDAASTFDLIVKHRKDLRVPREDFASAILGYGNLRYMSFGDAGYAMEQQLGKANSDEFRFIADNTIKVLNEYLESNPSDNDVRNTVKQFQETLRMDEKLRQKDLQKANDFSQTRNSSPYPDADIRLKKPSGSLSFLFALIGGVLAYFLGFRDFWQIIIGLLVGSFVAVVFHNIFIEDMFADENYGNARQVRQADGLSQYKKTSCAKCGKPMWVLSGPMRVVDMSRLMNTSQLIGCFRCFQCGGYYCFECSDSSKACICGEQSWTESLYFPMNPNKLGYT